jgi:hypothetical protein
VGRGTWGSDEEKRSRMCLGRALSGQNYDHTVWELRIDILLPEKVVALGLR